MTQLELLFNLLALFSFILMRNAFLCGKTVRGILSLVALALTALLALGSKENAVLIPLQLLIIERFCEKTHPAGGNRGYANFRWALFFIPSLIVTLYLLKILFRYLITGDSHNGRDFTVWERLLSEFRIIGDYLILFLIPKIQTAGVFHDGFTKSTGWFSPISTAIWFLVHVCLLTVAFIIRKRLSVVTFGLVWFYINHLLESTFVQLELKFEHRNYLPSIGLALVLAQLAVLVPLKNSMRFLMPAIFGLYLAVTCYMRASLWGNPLLAVGVWVKENPRSFRANEFAATLYSAVPEGEATAKRYLTQAISLSSGDPIIELKLLGLNCMMPVMSIARASELRTKLRRGPRNWQVGAVIESLGTKITLGECPHISPLQLQELIGGLLKNVNYRGTSLPAQLRFEYVRLELMHGKPFHAMALTKEWFDNPSTSLGITMRLAVLLASSGEEAFAYKLLGNALARPKLAERNSLFLIEQANEIRRNINHSIHSDGNITEEI